MILPTWVLTTDGNDTAAQTDRGRYEEKCIRTHFLCGSEPGAHSFINPSILLLLCIDETHTHHAQKKIPSSRNAQLNDKDGGGGGGARARERATIIGFGRELQRQLFVTINDRPSSGTCCMFRFCFHTTVAIKLREERRRGSVPDCLFVMKETFT